MAIESFPELPPFPADVPTADLPQISYAKLQAGDEVEVYRLFEACKHWGFFLLDLRNNVDGSALLDLADQVMEIGHKVFDLDLEEKNKYICPASKFIGYKCTGGTIVDNEGNKDRFESYGNAKDDLLGLKNAPNPAVMNKSISTIRSFAELGHSVITTILDRLDNPLDLPNSTLANMHRLMKPAESETRILKFPPQPVDDRRNAVTSHTNIDTATILFSKVGGLQVVPPQDITAWEYIRPVPGCTIVNLGDAMVKLTRGLLRSSLHRVVSAPGAQAECTKLSVCYLARPEKTTQMKGLESSVIPKLAEGEVEDDVNTKDWQDRRFAALKSATFKKEIWQLTRGTEEQILNRGNSTQTEKASSVLVHA